MYIRNPLHSRLLCIPCRTVPYPVLLQSGEGGTIQRHVCVLHRKFYGNSHYVCTRTRTNTHTRTCTRTLCNRNFVHIPAVIKNSIDHTLTHSHTQHARSHVEIDFMEYNSNFLGNVLQLMFSGLADATIKEKLNFNVFHLILSSLISYYILYRFYR